MAADGREIQAGLEKAEGAAAASKWAPVCSTDSPLPRPHRLPSLSPLSLQWHGKLILVGDCVPGIVQSQSVCKYVLGVRAILLIRYFNGVPQLLQMRKLGLRAAEVPAQDWLDTYCLSLFPLLHPHPRIQRSYFQSLCQSSLVFFLTDLFAAFLPSSLSPSLSSLSQVS